MQLFSIVLTAPAIFGARALLCRVSDGEKLETADLKIIFRWYTDLSLAGRAILLYGMVSLLERAFHLLSAGIGLYYFSSSSASGAAGSLSAFAVFLASVCVLLIGLLLAWSILPAGRVLASSALSFHLRALGRCAELMRVWFAVTFYFRLSFVMCFLCILLTYNALKIFCFPNYQIAEACYLKRLEPGKNKYAVLPGHTASKTHECPSQSAFWAVKKAASLGFFGRKDIAPRCDVKVTV